MNNTSRIATLVLCGALGACATYPTGPSMMALPGSGASFDQFRADDYQCQSYAQQTLGINSPQQSASDSGVNSAAVGTAVGAAAGALVGWPCARARGWAPGRLAAMIRARPPSTSSMARSGFGVTGVGFGKGSTISY